MHNQEDPCVCPRISLDCTLPEEVWQASCDGNMEVMLGWLKFGGQVNLCTASGGNLLHAASSYGRSDLVEILLMRADVHKNLQDSQGRTPVHCAVYGGYAECLMILLQTKTKCILDLTLKDARGATPLDIAAHRGQLDLINHMAKYIPDTALPTLQEALSMAHVANHHRVVGSLNAKMEQCLLNLVTNGESAYTAQGWAVACEFQKTTYDQTRQANLTDQTAVLHEQMPFLGLERQSVRETNLQQPGAVGGYLQQPGAVGGYLQQPGAVGGYLQQPGAVEGNLQLLGRNLEQHDGAGNNYIYNEHVSKKPPGGIGWNINIHSSSGGNPDQHELAGRDRVSSGAFSRQVMMPSQTTFHHASTSHSIPQAESNFSINHLSQQYKKIPSQNDSYQLKPQCIVETQRIQPTQQHEMRSSHRPEDSATQYHTDHKDQSTHKLNALLSTHPQEPSAGNLEVLVSPTRANVLSTSSEKPQPGPPTRLEHTSSASATSSVSAPGNTSSVSTLRTFSNCCECPQLLEGTLPQRVWEAASRGNTELIKRWLNTPGANVNARHAHGDTLLHAASFNGRTMLLRMLLAQPNVHRNVKNSEGNTAILDAVRRWKVDCVILLLETPCQCGINLLVTDNIGKSAMCWALSEGRLQLLIPLLEHTGLAGLAHLEELNASAQRQGLWEFSKIIIRRIEKLREEEYTNW